MTHQSLYFFLQGKSSRETLQVFSHDPWLVNVVNLSPQLWRLTQRRSRDSTLWPPQLEGRDIMPSSRPIEVTLGIHTKHYTVPKNPNFFFSPWDKNQGWVPQWNALHNFYLMVTRKQTLHLGDTNILYNLPYIFLKINLVYWNPSMPK